MMVDEPIRHSIVPLRHPPHYLMHKYWARKPHNVVRTYVNHFTRPGDIVLDPFAGSGVTLVESILTGRKAIACDINPVASLITEATVADFDPKALRAAYAEIEKTTRSIIDQWFTTECPSCMGPSSILYVVWQNTAQCNSCNHEIGLGEADRNGRKYICPSCGSQQTITSADVAGERMICIWYRCDHCGGDQLRQKEPDQTDLRLVRHLSDLPLHARVPARAMFKNPRILVPEGRTVDWYFTPRNLWALALIMDAIDAVLDPNTRKLLQFTFTSGVAQASKLIPYRNNLTTGGPAWSIPGFWVPNIHLEMNAWNCFSNRFKKLVRGKQRLARHLESHPFRAASSFNDLEGAPNAWILTRSATDLAEHVPTESVDYIFTDPPYGDSVPYLEFSSIWLAWLGLSADYTHEIVISDSVKRGKHLANYEALLRQAFRECYRVLKRNSWLSLTFNNRDFQTWKAIVAAVTDAGFRLINSVYQLPAVIPSKAQRAKAGSAIGDIVLNFRKINDSTTAVASETDQITDQMVLSVGERIIAERGGTATTDELNRGIILSLLERKTVDVSRSDFTHLLQQRFLHDDGLWRFSPEDSHIVSRYPQLRDEVARIVDGCLEQGLSHKKQILAEVLSRMSGSQTPDLGMITQVYDEVVSKREERMAGDSGTQMALF